MNYTVLLLFLMLVNTSLQKYTYDVKYITVPLDHFSFKDNATFKLRYLINDSYWSTNGPIFFYTGNEGDINMFAQNTGFIWDIAPEFQALVVFAEHRYYGTSLPFGNLSFTAPKYVGYLTSTQALADYVQLIDFLQESHNYYDENYNNPVIAFGGSYGGMLAAWLRMKYPASVIGALASSAPIWQFGQMVPCDVFNRIVTSVYRYTTPYDCSKFISSSWDTIRTVAATNEGKNWISTNWKFCKPLKTDEDVTTLLDWLSDVYANMAMVNYPYPTDFFLNLPAYPIKAFCSKLQNAFLDPKKVLQQLRNALSVYVNNTGTAECMNIFEKSTKLGELGWNFQACTELVMPMCSKDKDMFISKDWDFKTYAKNCFNQWGIQINTEKLAILEYGGKNLHSSSNIIFSNGLLDPWSGGGMLKNISKTVVAYIIPDAAHHLDLRSYNPSDPRTVIQARNFYKKIMRSWLKIHYMDYFNTYYY